MFPAADQYAQAKAAMAVCDACPHVSKCAMDRPKENAYGVWGGVLYDDGHLITERDLIAARNRKRARARAYVERQRRLK